jgi:methionyl-tRNA synthetase
MLRAAEDNLGPDGALRCEVLDAGNTPTGTRVVLEGANPNEQPGEAPAEITVDTFFGIPLRVTGHTVTVGGKALTLDGKPVKTAIIADAEIH